MRTMAATKDPNAITLYMDCERTARAYTRSCGRKMRIEAARRYRLVAKAHRQTGGAR